MDGAARVLVAFSLYDAFHGERAGGESSQAEDLEWSKSEVAVRRRYDPCFTEGDTMHLLSDSAWSFTTVCIRTHDYRVERALKGSLPCKLTPFHNGSARMEADLLRAINRNARGTRR